MNESNPKHRHAQDQLNGTFIIPSTRDQTFIVDTVDAELDANLWTAMRNRDSDGWYAYRKTGEKPHQTNVFLHRMIMERILGRSLDSSEEVDHIDGNTHNNCRYNLRLATSTQNKYNAKRRRDNTSGLKGVSWHKSRQKWQANIRVNGTLYYLGLFDTAELAHEAYCTAAKEHFGEFARFE